MMWQMLILHGEHEIKSRQKLIELVETAKKTGREVSWLDGKKLTLSELESSLGSNSLFGSPQTIILEQLFAGPKSKRKDELVNWLKLEVGQNTYPMTDLILWENKTLTATQIKNFGPASVELFKLSNAVFSWLDNFSLVSKNKATQLKYLKAAIEAESAEFCFVMLVRQIRLLIQVKNNLTASMPPFMVSKLKQQVQPVSEAQLIDFHNKLFEVDRRLKNGLSPANLSQELEVLILKS